MLAAAVGFATTAAFGSTIATIEGDPSGTAVSLGTTNDPAAVITYIASAPGTGDGYTYTNYAFLANDGTGSLEVFGKIPASNTYTPAVGDAISASGTYSPFNAIPEVETLTAISQTSTGNSVPGTVIVTIPQLQALTGGSNFGIQEYLLELDNVTLSGASTFATHANTTLTATDGSANTVTVYQYASSYSKAGALGGTAIPAGPVDLTGIVDVFGGTSVEFIPFTVTSVPEPTTITLLAMGGCAMLARRRRRGQTA